MELTGLVLGGIGGLGVGSILANLVSHFTSRQAVVRDRQYSEKREAYLGLLSALHLAAVKASDEHAKNFGHWQLKCELFGSADVARFAQRVADTAPRTEERNIAFRSLIDAMKADLNR